MQRLIDVFAVAPSLLCWGLERLMLTACADVRVVGNASTLADAKPLLQQSGADVLVVDMDAADDPGGLREAALQCPLVLLVGERDRSNAGWAGSGAAGVVSRADTPAHLLATIRGAVDRGRSDAHRPQPGQPGQLQWSVDSAAASPDRMRIKTLTSRERQLVFAAVCNSTASGKVLASRLCISEHTLRNHLTSIYCKLGVRSRLSLHAFVQRNRLEADTGFWSESVDRAQHACLRIQPGETHAGPSGTSWG